jgi:hypothetical protein
MTRSIRDISSRNVLLDVKFNHSVLVKQYTIWSHIGRNPLDQYFRLRKTATAIELNPFTLIKQSYTDAAQYQYISMALTSLHRSVNVEYDIIRCSISEHMVGLWLFLSSCAGKRFPKAASWETLASVGSSSLNAGIFLL